MFGPRIEELQAFLTLFLLRANMDRRVIREGTRSTKVYMGNFLKCRPVGIHQNFVNFAPSEMTALEEINLVSIRPQTLILAKF
jgi:hypothetical protein